MKLNGIWSNDGGQRIIFSMSMAKKWVGKYPPCPPGFDASDYCWSIWHHFYISACMMCLLIKWTFLAIRWRAKSFIDFLKSRFKLITVPNLIQGGHSKVGHGSKFEPCPISERPPCTYSLINSNFGKKFSLGRQTSKFSRKN